MAKDSTKKEPVPKFVSQAEFKELQGSVETLVGLVKESLKKSEEIPQTPEAKKVEVEISKAGPKPFITPVNPEWEQVARDIIGAEKVERCEMEHLRAGGLIFTVVVKREFSNAPDNYLQTHKEDRRSKEIGAEGIGGVENWCKLIAQNLKRGKSYVSV